MTDAAARKDEIVIAGRDADSARLSNIERWYRERCMAIAEICIVPAGMNLHAVVVPNFVLLREQRHPNTRELIRFDFHSASKFLAAEERPESFSVLTRPLPRNPSGEPDRERIRAELLEGSRPSATPTHSRDSAVAAGVRACIGLYRPEVNAADRANLELDLRFDSLDRVLLFASVEEAFGIAIPEDEAASIFTISDLIDAVESRAQKCVAPSLPSWSDILNQPLDATERSMADGILRQRPAMTLLAWSGAQCLRLLGRSRFQFEMTGTERLPRHGAWLLAANHCSHLDPLFLAWALPYGIARRLSFMGHTEYFGAGWKAAVAKRLKLVPVDPDAHALRGMKLCAEALRRGLIGAVFPEGERSPNGAQQRFHRGIAVLAREMHVPIVPAAICGSYEVLPRGRDRIRSAPVQVRFGDAVHADASETEENLLARLWMAVSRLRGPDAHAREPMPLPIDMPPIMD